MQRYATTSSYLALCTVLAACQASDKPSADDAPDAAVQPSVPATVDLGPPRELTMTAPSAQLAFQQEGVSYRAGYLTHRARITDGTLYMTPFHFDGVATVEGSVVAFRTQRVRRGARGLENQPEIATLSAEGDVVLDRGEVIERFRNREEGVEQSWAFSIPPRGDGSLVVEVEVTGHSTVASSATGLHFHTPGKLGFSYSHAVWRDAADDAWNVPVRWEAGRIVIEVPAHVLAASKFPAVLDPIVGAENGVNSLAVGNTGAVAREPAIAFSGSRYLAVWRDDRLSRSSDIYAVRLASDGTLLESRSILVTNAAGTQSKPVVVGISSGWLVAWEDAGNVYAATVSPQGAVTQLGAVAATSAAETLLSAASRGTDTLLVWQSDLDVRGAVYASGAFGAPFDIAATINEEKDPAVAASSVGYLVAWNEGAAADDLRGQFVAGDGTLTGVAFDISVASGVQNEAAAAFDGTNFVVVWHNGDDVYGTRIAPDGTVLDQRVQGGGMVGGVAISTAADQQRFPAVSCDLSSCFVIWADRRAVSTNGFDVYGQRLDFSFAPQGGEVVVSAPLRYQLAPAIAGNPSGGWIAAWQDSRTGGADIVMATRVSSAGAVVDVNGFSLNRSYVRQEDGAYARSTSTQLAVWADSQQIGTDIMGIRYSASGTRLDSEALTVSGSAGSQSTPAVSFDGTQFLAVWVDGRNATRDIFAARFSEAGALLDAAGIPVTTAAQDQLWPDVASGGGVSLAVWADRRNLANGFDLMGAIVTSGGVVSVSDVAVCSTSGDQVRPAVTFDPASGVFVVVWSDERNPGDPDVYAARVQTDGTVLDPCGVLVSGAANGQLRPDIAAADSQLLVVWDDRGVDVGGDIWAARLNTSGGLNVLDASGFVITSGVNAQGAPTVVGLPQGAWGIAWVDGLDLRGQQVAADGALSVPGGFVISASSYTDSEPTFMNSTSTQQRVWLVYQRNRTDLETTRLMIQPITFDELAGQSDLGDVCSTNDDCSTGFCVDGFCCDAACGGSYNHDDCQTCAVKWGATADGTCSPAASGRICRYYADGFCDLSERCDGVSTSCPDDVGQHAGEVCDLGSGAVCPANGVSGAPHVCPEDTGDLGKVCSNDGDCSTGFCVDGFCCDSACGGSYNHSDCQTCAIKWGAVANGVCSPVAAGRICRYYADTFCDAVERCDGMVLACPDDLGRNEAEVCDSGSGAVCPANDISGAPHVCP